MKKESNAMEEELISVLKAVYKADISITQGVSVIQDIIRLAEESLVQRVRLNIQSLDVSSNLAYNENVLVTIGAVLSLPSLTPKPKGDK